MTESPSFETNMKRLEEITAALESSSLSLEESMKLYREGSERARLCREELAKARHELEICQSAELESRDMGVKGAMDMKSAEDDGLVEF